MSLPNQHTEHASFASVSVTLDIDTVINALMIGGFKTLLSEEPVT